MKAMIPIVLIVGALLCSEVSAVEVLTFENGVNGVQILDGRVRAGRDTNWGGANVIAGHVSQPSTIIVDGMFGNGAGQIPAGAPIVDAKLRIYMYHNIAADEDQTLHAHVLNVDLRSHTGNKDGAVEAGEMTWTKKSWPNVGWGANEDGSAGPVSGEDYSADIYSVFNAVGLPAPDANVNEWFDIDLTPIVQDWQDGTYANNGVLLLGQEGSGMYFWSTEQPGFEPRMIVSIVPEPASAMLMLLGASVLARRRRR